MTRGRLGGARVGSWLIFAALVTTLGCPPAKPPAKPRSPTANQGKLPALATSPEEALRLSDKDREAGRLVEAERRLAALITVAPEHLEAWVLRAMIAEAGGKADEPGARTADGPTADKAWRRVERILVYSGKLQPFVLQSTLFFAARRYAKLDVEARAVLFIEELMRRFPASKWSAQLRLLQARLASERKRWGAVLLACGQLAKLPRAGGGAGLRCRPLARHARRLRDLGPAPSPGAASWAWEAPRPTGNALHDVWVGPGGEVFAVGVAGTLLQGRAGKLAPAPSPTRWDLLAVGGRSASALYAVGRGGVVIGRGAGGRWAELRSPSPSATDLRDVYVTAAGLVVAVGQHGTVVERNGTSRPFTERRVAKASLRAVWGAGDGSVYAVGDEGTVLRRRADGSWTQLKTDTYEDLWDIHGRSAKDLLAVGSKRTVVYIGGGAGKEDVIGLTDLRGVWAGPNSRAWAVGRAGGIVGGRGRRWRSHRKMTLVDLNAVSGDPRGREVWAVGDGGTIMTARGDRWRIVSGGMRQDLVAVSAGARPPLALGERGALLTRGAGGRWSQRALPVVGRYRALWSDRQRVAAVGERGLLIVRGKPGGAFRKVKTGSGEDLNALWGGSRYLIAVGGRGTVVRLLAGSRRVVREQLPSALELRGVSGRSSGAERVVAVGVRGVVLAFDGRRWREEPTGTLAALNAVWIGKKREIAVGERGTVVVRTGTGGWKAQPSPTSQDLVGIWGASDRSVYAVSDRGTVIHFDGARWRVQRSPAACLRAISGAPGLGVLAVGCNGGVVRAPIQ